MASSGASGSQLADSLGYFQSLYDRHRFLDLYSKTSDYWNSATEVDSLSADVLVLSGRLAGRLGGLRLSRWLLRRAFHRDPSSPRVRYFTRHLNPLRVRFLDELKAFVDHPDVGGDDLEVRASWYASYAFTWARLRDFDHAYECIRIAHSLVQNDSWVLCLESEVYGMADRWSDALRSAERALEVDPDRPLCDPQSGNGADQSRPSGRIGRSFFRRGGIKPIVSTCPRGMLASVCFCRNAGW